MRIHPFLKGVDPLLRKESKSEEEAESEKEVESGIYHNDLVKNHGCFNVGALNFRYE